MLELTARYDQLRGQRDLAGRKLAAAKTQAQEAVEAWTDAEEVKAFFIAAGSRAQQQIKDQIEDWATLALQSTFDRPYKLVLSFGERRGQPECDLGVVEGDGEPFDPTKEQGGGLADVLSLALRTILWAMGSPQTSPFFGWDEPGTNVSLGFQPTYSQVIHEISEELHIQFLIVTHESRLAMAADKIFVVEKVDGVSGVGEGTAEALERI